PHGRLARRAAHRPARLRRKLVVAQGRLHGRAVGGLPRLALFALWHPSPAAAPRGSFHRRVRIVTCGSGGSPSLRHRRDAVNLPASGCNGASASVELREKLAFDPQKLAHALTELPARYGAEAVVLGTCN